MDVKSLVDALLPALSASGFIADIALHTEGPIVSGRAYLSGSSEVSNSSERFVRFYFNQTTGTLAFALIVQQQRVWGIDYDNRRGWHLHPVNDPTSHIPIPPLSVSAIVKALQDVVSAGDIFDSGKIS